MKNQVLVLALVALSVPSFCQVIDSTYLEEYIVMKNGKKTMLDITSDDADFVYFVKDGKENKVPKAQLTDWKAGVLWQQPFKYNDKGKIEYQEVVQLDSLSKDKIYERARRMFTNLFKDARKVLELEDKEAGTLIGNGNSSVTWKTDGILGMYVSVRLWYTITIDVKDGKYRLTLNNFDNETDGYRVGSTYISGSRYPLEQAFPQSGEVQKIQRGLKEAELLEIQALFSTIKKMMLEKPSKDW